MKKLLGVFSISFMIMVINPLCLKADKKFNVGDTAYIYAKNAGKTTWFSKRDLVFYAKVSVEKLAMKEQKFI